MSSPEASIEEILASIRKTFTDEPEAQGSKPVESYSEARPSGMPPFRSATETALASGSAPLPTPPRSRAAAIDDDLDDLIDKSSQIKSASTPSEPVVPQPTVPSPAAAVSPVEAAREKWANLLNPHSHSNGSAAKAAEVKSEVAHQPAPPAPAPAPAPSSGLFAPRKGGFYPPQDARPDPILPMPAAAPPPAPAEAKSPATPPFGASAASTPETPPASAAPRPGFIPFPPTKSTAPEPAPAPATLSGATSAMTASATAAPAVSPASASVADVPAASSRALDDLVAELNSVAHVSAESAASAPVTLSEPLAPAPTAQTEPAPSMQAAAATSATATGTEAASAASAGRSFEDVVADMLRPLLEKWIDENMPRIVERALQRDAALGRKPGQ